METTWGNFQSFIQLAIALNSAFAAFGSYAGNDITKEKARLARIMRAVKNGASLPVLGHETVGGVAELMLLEGRCEDLLHRYNNFVTGLYRVVCVATAAVGIGLLLYSSILPNQAITPFWMFVTFIFYIPFYFGIYKVGKLSWNVYMQVSLKSKIMEDRIKRQLSMGGTI